MYYYSSLTAAATLECTKTGRNPEVTFVAYTGKYATLSWNSSNKSAQFTTTCACYVNGVKRASGYTTVMNANGDATPYIICPV